MSSFSERAKARQGRVTLTKLPGKDPGECGEVRGPEALSLVTQLSKTAWAFTGKPIPQLARHELPIRFVPVKKSV
jgi:hypothetical protein